MGRLGILYRDVEKAANELIGAGVKPTVDAVRYKLGTGSKSTIVLHLKRWREALAKNHAMPPQALPTELMSLIQHFYQQLKIDTELVPNPPELRRAESPHSATPLSHSVENEVQLLRSQLEFAEQQRAHLLQEKSQVVLELKKLKQKVKSEQLVTS